VVDDGELLEPVDDPDLTDEDGVLDELVEDSKHNIKLIFFADLYA